MNYNVKRTTLNRIEIMHSGVVSEERALQRSACLPSSRLLHLPCEATGKASASVETHQTRPDKLVKKKQTYLIPIDRISHVSCIETSAVILVYLAVFDSGGNNREQLATV